MPRPITQAFGRERRSLARAGKPVEGNTDDAEIRLFRRDARAVQVAPVAVIAVLAHVSSPFGDFTVKEKSGQPVAVRFCDCEG
ncbi:MAG: hypothetical protein HND47_06015 [Chloroflexi bacterium]|nr:hypothetical protein [Chloroflexota bacterium]